MYHVVPEEHVAFFIRKLLEALLPLHQNSTVLLDMKPENITLVDGKNEVHLLDFGSSRKLSSCEPVYGILRVPEFTAPEVVLQQPVQTTTDCWSVGVLAYIMLSGVSPFHGDSDTDILRNITQAKWSFTPAVFSSVSTEAKCFIERLLHPHPGSRATSAEALQHPWLNAATVDFEPPLLSDILSEVRYSHHWLERRVFMQNSLEEVEEVTESASSQMTTVSSDTVRACATSIDSSCQSEQMSKIEPSNRRPAEPQKLTIGPIRHPAVKALQNSIPALAAKIPLNVEIPDGKCINIFSGVKSPVSPKPAKGEVVMEVVISSHSCSPCISPAANGLVEKPFADDEYDELMKAVRDSRFVKRSRGPLTFNDLPGDKGAHGNAESQSKTPDNAENAGYHKWLTEEYSWESDYQMGPETFLLQPRDPGFASRIRDYRRATLDGQSFTNRCILNHLDKHVAVHERRRFSDLIHTDEMLGKLADDLDVKMEALRTGKVRALHGIKPPALSPTPNQADKRHLPVFEYRIKNAVIPSFETSVAFECKCVSEPHAQMTWYLNDSLLAIDERHVVTVHQNHTARLVVKKALASDIGVYKCVAENELGSTCCSARLILSDVPDRPSRPDIQLASDTEVFIVWEPSCYTGGLESVYYKLEYRRAGGNNWSFPWFTISDCLDSTAVIIKRLEPLGIYQFRVSARNLCGTGEPSLSSRIIQTHHRGAPKLSIELLRKEYILNIVNLPTSGDLGDIPEDVDPFSKPAVNMDLVNGGSLEVEGKMVELQIVSNMPTCFQFESEIFRGRYCCVRNAVDKTREHSAHCAVKIIPLNSVAQPYIMQEFNILRQVKHENVILLLSAFQNEDSLMLFMEKMHETILDRFTFYDYYTEEQLARVVTQILTALQWMHFKRIVYLNLLPDNIMFQSKNEWNIKLIDMGAAVCLDDDNTAKTGPNISPTFVAPEVLQDNMATPLSDSWGIGVLCFILLSGVHPFEADSNCQEDVTKNILNEKLDINWIFTNATQEALRFATLALKKHPRNRMTTEEGLQHKWLSLHDHMRRRRENIRFSSNRLRQFVKQCSIRSVDARTAALSNGTA